MAPNTFSADPQATWITEVGSDLRMQLLQDFQFMDPDGKLWLAPKNLVTDGASIPKAFWSSIGSPFTGDYRRAALVHDAACDAGSGVPRDVADKMFYQACLAGGCSTWDAKILYAGVRIGAWAKTQAQTFATSFAITPAKLPGENDANELELRARLTLIGRELEKTPDDFELVKAVVSKHLAI